MDLILTTLFIIFQLSYSEVPIVSIGIYLRVNIDVNNYHLLNQNDPTKHHNKTIS